MSSARHAQRAVGNGYGSPAASWRRLPSVEEGDEQQWSAFDVGAAGRGRVPAQTRCLSGMGSKDSGPGGCWDPWSSSAARTCRTECINGDASTEFVHNAEIVVSQSLSRDTRPLSFNRSAGDVGQRKQMQRGDAPNSQSFVRRVQQQSDPDYPEFQSSRRPISSSGMERGPGAAFGSQKPREEDWCTGAEFRSCEIDICGDMDDAESRRKSEIRIAQNRRH